MTAQRSGLMRPEAARRPLPADWARLMLGGRRRVRPAGFMQEDVMLTLVLSITLAIAVCFLCSLAETVLYTLPWSAIERLRRSGRPAGAVLYKLRLEVNRPIAAILTLNTIANTAGATVAGAAFLAQFGPDFTALFAVGFTGLLLILGEILPKSLGVAHTEALAVVMARPLAVLTRLLAPLLWVTTCISRLVVRPRASGPMVSEDDIRAVASLSRQAGRIKPYEEAFIRNVLALDQKRVYDVMTPRTVVFSLPENATVEAAYNDPRIWHFSRVPVYGDDNEDIVGFVERRALARNLRDGQGGLPLAAVLRPINFILENQTLDVLLREMLEAHEHLFAVLDEYGGLAGVVSLEDVVEEILGSEIVDESDNVEDLRALARRRREAATRGKI